MEKYAKDMIIFLKILERNVKKGGEWNDGKCKFEDDDEDEIDFEDVFEEEEEEIDDEDDQLLLF